MFSSTKKLLIFHVQAFLCVVSFALYFLAIFHFFPLKTIRKNIANIQMFNIFKLDVLIAS